jgi:hypothetical protein
VGKDYMRGNVAFEADIKECIADMLLESVNEQVKCACPR